MLFRSAYSICSCAVKCIQHTDRLGSLSLLFLQESPRPGDCLKAAPDVHVTVRDPSGEVCSCPHLKQALNCSAKLKRQWLVRLFDRLAVQQLSHVCIATPLRPLSSPVTSDAAFGHTHEHLPSASQVTLRMASPQHTAVVQCPSCTMAHTQQQ